jgi:hypothetical protein
VLPQWRNRAGALYPHKPGKVCDLVTAKSGRKFTSNNHVQAWRLFKARPKLDAKQPANTNKEYCIYQAAHRDYTYSDKLVDFLVGVAKDDGEFAKLKAVKI